MKNLVLTFLAFLVFLSAHSRSITDFNGLLTEQQLLELQDQCNRIRQTHNLHLNIYLFREFPDIVDPSQIPGNHSGVVQVLVNLSDSTVLVRTASVSDLRKSFFEQVFFQFLHVPMNEGAPLATGLSTTLSEIMKELDRQKQAREQQQQEAEQLDKYDPRAAMMLQTFLLLGVASYIVYRIKIERIQNKYEARSFYGISRLPSGMPTFLGIVLFFCGGYLIFQYIATGRWTVMFAFCIVFYPILVFLTTLITIVLDLFSLQEHNTEDIEPTLGQMLWLVRPTSNTEHLMELTFYEQIITKKIKLEIDNSDYNRRRVTEFYISPGEKFDSNVVFKIDEAPFFLELYTTPDALKPYLHRIYESFGKFLVYRKDHVLRGLFRSGYLTRSGYLLNTFGLTAKGRDLQKKLRKVEQMQTHLILQGLQDASQIPDILPRLTPQVLLIKDFESQLTNFYNAVVDSGFLDQALALPFGFLFHPDFSLRAFNVRLSSAYVSVVVSEGGIDEGDL